MRSFTLTAFTTLALATLAAASHRRARSNTCSTGPVQCCKSVERADSPAVHTLLGLLGVVVGDVVAQIGISCSPLNLLSISATSCSSQTVCCENNEFKGIVAIGCTPINISL